MTTVAPSQALHDDAARRAGEPVVAVSGTDRIDGQAADGTPADGARLDERWPALLARRHRAVVLQRADAPPLLRVEAPPPPMLLQAVEARLRTAADWQLCEPGQMDGWLEQAEQAFRALDGVAEGPRADAAAEDLPELSARRLARHDGSPAVRLLEAVLFDALRDAASDIHLESQPGGADLRLRIDGVLQPMRRIEGAATAEQIVSRLKVMAELDIGERRLPQDGRFKLRLSGSAGGGERTRDIDFRVSIMPSIHGEDAVIRILDRAAVGAAPAGEAAQLSLAALGFDAAMAARIGALARAPHGMLLVTGPTGSGKTTTLYAALGLVDTRGHKVITIEDPVEYQVPGVVHIPVNEKKGLTFARGLRSILRHDPDHVMVGEIRDAETAQIAVQAALTGHGVFTTVHANSAFDVIGRFMHMGLDLYNVAAALNAVLAQRLLRQVCRHCASPVDATPSALRRLAGRTATLQAGRGCAHCHGSGYRGRHAVAELLPFDDTLRDLVAGRAPLSQIKRHAREQGMQSLREAALDAVARGDTTFEELDRVTLDG